MEATGVGEAIQVANVVINGSVQALELSGKLAHFMGHELKELIKLLYARHLEVKNSPEILKPGEIDLIDLHRNANDKQCSVEVFKIDSKSLDKFVEYAEKGGIAYSILAFSGNGPNKYISYSSEQQHLIQPFLIENCDIARASDLGEYYASCTTKDKYDAERMVDRLSGINKYIDDIGDNIKDNRILVSKEQISAKTPNSVEIKVNINGKELYVDIPNDSIEFEKNGDMVLKLKNGDVFNATTETSYISENGIAKAKKILGDESKQEIFGKEITNALAEKDKNIGSKAVKKEINDDFVAEEIAFVEIDKSQIVGGNPNDGWEIVIQKDEQMNFVFIGKDELVVNATGNSFIALYATKEYEISKQRITVKNADNTFGKVVGNYEKINGKDVAAGAKNMKDIKDKGATKQKVTTFRIGEQTKILLPKNENGVEVKLPSKAKTK